MKAWIAGLLLLTSGCISAVVYSPVFTGTWIIKSKHMDMVRAIVFTVGLAEAAPLVSVREVSAPREDQQLYNAIHDAARISRSNGHSTEHARTANRHWGGEQSWCDQEDCHRVYIFFGSAGRREPDPGPSAICQSATPVIHKDSRSI
jgi:hypothetical protein